MVIPAVKRVVLADPCFYGKNTVKSEAQIQLQSGVHTSTAHIHQIQVMCMVFSLRSVKL